MDSQSGPPVGGAGDQFAPGIQGLTGFFTDDFNISTAGQALKGILSQSKGRGRKKFVLSRSQGSSFRGFVSEPPKALGSHVHNAVVTVYAEERNLTGSFLLLFAPPH